MTLFVFFDLSRLRLFCAEKTHILAVFLNLSRVSKWIYRVLIWSFPYKGSLILLSHRWELSIFVLKLQFAVFLEGLFWLKKAFRWLKNIFRGFRANSLFYFRHYGEGFGAWSYTRKFFKARILISETLWIDSFNSLFWIISLFNSKANLLKRLRFFIFL